MSGRAGRALTDQRGPHLLQRRLHVLLRELLVGDQRGERAQPALLLGHRSVGGILVLLIVLHRLHLDLVQARHVAAELSDHFGLGMGPEMEVPTHILLVDHLSVAVLA